MSAHKPYRLADLPALEREAEVGNMSHGRVVATVENNAALLTVLEALIEYMTGRVILSKSLALQIVNNANDLVDQARGAE